MTTFKRYLFYCVKNSSLRMIVSTILSAIISQVMLADCIDHTNISYCTSGINILATILGIFSTIIPILELSQFKNRRNLDTLYFFPIKREKMALAHYICGFYQISIIYTVTFATNFLFLVFETDFFELNHMIPYYFYSLLLGLVIYSVFMFIFIQANSITDGILFCFIWIFILSIVSYTFIDIFNLESIAVTYQKQNWGIIYAPLDKLTKLYRNLIEINDPYPSDYLIGQIKEQAFMFFVWVAVGIIAAIGYVFSFAKKRAENAGEISNSWFGYKMLIPVYTFCPIFLMRSDGIKVLSISFLILMIIGYIIYRRGVKFQKSDIILMVSGLILMLVTT